MCCDVVQIELLDKFRASGRLPVKHSLSAVACSVQAGNAGLETKNLYQYFDATAQAEYLYECVAETIEKDLREEIGSIQTYDRALDETKEIVGMPDKRVAARAFDPAE